jgi:hypothetical protein
LIEAHQALPRLDRARVAFTLVGFEAGVALDQERFGLGVPLLRRQTFAERAEGDRGMPVALEQPATLDAERFTEPASARACSPIRVKIKPEQLKA